MAYDHFKVPVDASSARTLLVKAVPVMIYRTPSVTAGVDHTVSMTR
jgi:hypothetical protein